MEKIPRHCGLCLVRILPENVNLCGGCERRAYCSQECQQKDWTSTKKLSEVAVVEESTTKEAPGQGHADWCGVPVCEEDVDWFLREDGKGVIAKRWIRKGERILIGQKDQLTLRTRPTPNSSKSGKKGEEMLFNHACDANAAVNFGLDYNVLIITAEKEIDVHEEITLNYIGFNSTFSRTTVSLEDGTMVPINSFRDVRKHLREHYGIICKKSCMCHNKKIEQIILKSKILQGSANILDEQWHTMEVPHGSTTTSSLDIIGGHRKLITDLDQIGGSRLRKAQMICRMLKMIDTVIPDMPPATYTEILLFDKKEALAILRSIFHPQSIYCRLEAWIPKQLENMKISRHCAFCLLPLAQRDVMNCGKCGRRAYCSQWCQKKDWKSQKDSKKPLGELEGQGHKDWCGLLTCEEDLDYYVQDSGKGVIAKRLIREGERILLGTRIQISERFGIGKAETVILNHACDPNASINDGADYKVGIICAEKDIQPGSEITMNIIGFNTALTEVYNGRKGMPDKPVNSFKDSRKLLESRHGIYCEPNCLCYNKELEDRIVIAKRLYADFQMVHDNRIHLEDEGRLQMVRVLEVNLLQNLVSYLDVFHGKRLLKAELLCQMLSSMGPSGELGEYTKIIPKYRKEAEDIFKSIYHPESAYSSLDTHVKFY